MADRINEDIRFYLPADPYYYQVDNLPIEDLLDNDKSLQHQIDIINSRDGGVNTVGRDGFLELQPHIDTALPGTVSVRAGNFIGRVQRTSGSDLNGAVVSRMNDGILEMNTPPTEGDDYSVNNPSTPESNPADYVGRTSVFNFMGGSISIDSFDFNDFQEGQSAIVAPLGRIDLIGITTVNGAMDDPFLPGNDTGGGMEVGDGYPKLAVVKGAGITTAQNGVRQLVIGEKYITIGTPQTALNDYGRDLAGNVVPNPEFGTVPSPDDVVNICFARDDISAALREFAQENRNGSFFLPIAYVYVPQSHVIGNPIPSSFLKDIRPFFRTAELTLAERQALAASENPSLRNPVITESSLLTKFSTEINWDTANSPIQDQINDIVNVGLSDLVKSNFQYRDMTQVVGAYTYTWSFIVVNGLIVGHVRTPLGGSTYAANPTFNLTNMGFETNDGNGQQSCMAVGFPYLGDDLEKGSWWRILNNGGMKGSWGENAFLPGSDIIFKFNYRNIRHDGDKLAAAALVVGKFRPDFNLASGNLDV